LPYSNQAKVIHSLSSKRNREGTANLQVKNKDDFLLTECKPSPSSNNIKIKLETGKKGKKDSNILEMKAH
jgi:hypothetical protein